MNINAIVGVFCGSLILYGLFKTSGDLMSEKSLTGTSSLDRKKMRKWAAAARRLGYDVDWSTRKGYKLDAYKNGKYVTSIGARGYGDYWHYYYTKGKEFADKKRRGYRARGSTKTIRGRLAKDVLW